METLFSDREQSRRFRRRVWRQQRGLCLLIVAIAVLGLVVGLLEAQEGTPSWLNLVWLACLGAAFVCFVLLVRRDDPPAES